MRALKAYRSPLILILLAAGLTVVLGACGSSNSPTSMNNAAQTYIRTTSNDVNMVSDDIAAVGQDIINNNLTQLASDAQTAHDDFNGVREDFVAAGNNVMDNNSLGTAENQIDNGSNELKNAMGAFVAYASNPNPGTLGSLNSQLNRGVSDYNQGIKEMWALAGESDPPIIGGGSSSSSAASTPPDTTTTPAPSGSQFAGCPNDPNIRVTSTASCPFGENTFYEAWKAQWDGSQPIDLTVYSPVTGKTYGVLCTLAGSGQVTCINQSDHTSQITFPMRALRAYTSADAAAYAAAGKLGPAGSRSSSGFVPGDHNPNDASASACERTMEIGPHSDCYVAQHVANDLGQGVWSAPGSDTVSEGSSTITFSCSAIGQDDTQAAQPTIYRCVSQTDPQDWFEFEFT